MTEKLKIKRELYHKIVMSSPTDRKLPLFKEHIVFMPDEIDIMTGEKIVDSLEALLDYLSTDEQDIKIIEKNILPDGTRYTTAKIKDEEKFLDHQIMIYNRYLDINDRVLYQTIFLKEKLKKTT